MLWHRRWLSRRRARVVVAYAQPRFERRNAALEGCYPASLSRVV
ncbi:MAG TPA: hypothetical protein VFO66_15230 [Gemmatimonadaceae bacterium]|nr:hypothetical protein [Gemmatimonadaceae bacterium]